MKTTFFATIAACAALAFAGCAPKEETPATGEEAGAKMESNATPAPESKGTSDAGTAGETTTAALAKCDGCGTEVESAKLAMHDGQNLCEKCIASHGH